MTQTKLEIIGPYTPDHEGPFCTRDGKPVDLRIRDGRGEYCLIGYIGERTAASTWGRDGEYMIDRSPSSKDLMNAREVPVAREFWIGLTANGANVYNSGNAAVSDCLSRGYPIAGIIHVREVLPGEE